jgi:hypothetical protein
MERHRFNQTRSLEERLAEEAKRLRAEAKALPPGAVRDELIRRARQAETGSHMSEWLRSPGLRPPESPFAQAETPASVLTWVIPSEHFDRCYVYPLEG